MADNTVLSTNVGTGDTIRTEDKTTFKTPVSLLDVGGTGAENLVTDGTQGMPTEGVAVENAAVAGNPVLVGGRYDSSARTLDTGDVGGIAVDVAGRVQVADGGGAISVDDNGSTISVDDGAGSLTVDGTVAATQSGTWNVATVTTVTGITNVVHVDDNSSTLSVDDGAGSLTVDNAALSVTGGGTEAAAMRVTVASDSTGVLSVDDNGGSLTVDGTVAATQSGTWNVGTVTTVTNVVHVDDNSATLSVDDGAGSLTVDNAGTFATQATLQAGTALAGKVSAGLDTANMYESATALTPKFAVISCSSSGDNTLVSGVSSKKIRVLSIALHIVGTAISIYFRENTAGTAIHANGTNPIPLDKTGAAGAAGFVLGFNPVGWFQSSAGNPLVLNLSGAQAVAGSLTYVEAS